MNGASSSRKGSIGRELQRILPDPQNVFENADRDITVDTTHASAASCALTIATHLLTLGPTKAFDRLRRTRS